MAGEKGPLANNISKGEILNLDLQGGMNHECKRKRQKH